MTEPASRAAWWIDLAFDRDAARGADLTSYDLGSAVANLRGVVLAGRFRFAEAERVFREVWASPTAPRGRRAVAGLALAAYLPPATDDGPAHPHRFLDDVRRLTDQVFEPLARNAVLLLLSDLSAHHDAEPTRRYPLHERLAHSPSVLAAFW
ncbi:hypothetical protein AB0F77_25720 [Streptomyces sp. NPDC026672]|uniref:hypothetical protein n=1 Tax=unclassified Streptomyces TaxID=2593676 RepID=UPI0033D01E3B